MSKNMIPLDVAILTTTTRLGVVRPWHLVAGLSASPWHVRGRLRHLVDAGCLVREVVSVDLRDRTSGQVRASQAHVYRVTGRGAGVPGPWRVPTYDDLAHQLPAVRVGRTHLAHAIGQSDLWSWYARTLGSDGTAGSWQIATEREVVSLEMSVKRGTLPRVVPRWTVMTSAGVQHPCDLAVQGGGGQWAIELERAQKTVQEYVDVQRGYRESGMGQIWHVLSQTTGKRLAEASARVGHPLGPHPTVRGVLVSQDGLTRLQGWLPGVIGTGGPETWKAALHLPAQPPAGLPAPAAPPALDSWRRGRVVSPDAPIYERDWWAA